MNRKFLGTIAVLAAVAVPGGALAADAIATADVNLRAGPSTQYPAVNVVYGGDDVRVFGCLETRSWCDVGYAGQRGWVSSNYLAYLDNGRRYTGPSVVAGIGAPIVTFSFGNYWDNYYRDRPFYRDRARYDRRDLREDRRDFRREVRRERREDRREDRQEFREERREDRRDFRQDVREERREDRRDVRRGDRRDEPREVRRDRREDRREARQERRERRQDRRD